MCVCVLIVIDDKSLSSQSLLKSESLLWFVVYLFLVVCVNLCGNVTTHKNKTDGVVSRELKTTLTTNDLKQIHTHQKHA